MIIGERIREVFEAMPKGCTVGWFAAELHCDRRNIYRIFAKENIDIQLLGRISRALGHDFFADLSGALFTAETSTFGSGAEATLPDPVETKSDTDCVYIRHIRNK